MLELNLISALTIVIAIMLFGEIISSLSKGKIPQMLIVAICFLIGYWTVFPKDILEISGIRIFADIMMSFILIHVGTMFNVKDMIKEWKSVVTTLFAVTGIVVAILGLGTLLFGKEVAFTAAAPMTGGGMAAMIMQQAADLAGKPELGMLAMLIFIMHGFFGFPLTAYFLGKESKIKIAEFRKNPGKFKVNEEQANTDNEKKKIYEYIPKKFRTVTFHLFILAILGFLCSQITKITGINNAIVQIILGIILNYFGVIPQLPLSKSDSNGILNLALLANFMNSFSIATFDVVVSLVIKIVVLMTIASIAIILVTIPIGKKFGYSKYLSVAIGLNCFLGFPFNFALTNEAIDGNTENEAEAAYLNSHLMPKMIIAGVVAVSLVSAVLAGIFAGIAFS